MKPEHFSYVREIIKQEWKTDTYHSINSIPHINVTNLTVVCMYYSYSPWEFCITHEELPHGIFGRYTNRDDADNILTMIKNTAILFT